MCLIENKQVPTDDILMMKDYIKDLSKDINTIRSEINGITSIKNLRERDLEIFLNDELYHLAKSTQRYIKECSKRIERLEIAEKTIEAIRSKYGIACQRLRDLYVRKNYFEQRRKDNLNVVSDSILRTKLKNISFEIKSIKSEYNLP